MPGDKFYSSIDIFTHATHYVFLNMFFLQHKVSRISYSRSGFGCEKKSFSNFGSYF